MQHILDIDLDFFLADCCPLAELGERPCLSGHEPWEAESVRNFLESNLGLSRENRVRGRIFETHDSALCFWRELIARGELKAPFSVTHIDAHSDLGIGYPGPGFVLCSVITTPLEKRVDLERYYAMHELDEANYLLFALGFRWICELENVRNPRSREDVPKEILKFNENGERCGIRLESFASRLFEAKNGAEPTLSYREYRDPFAYTAHSRFDFMSLAISPRYAPREADALVEVIREYMDSE